MAYGICFLLGAITLAAYWNVSGFDFVNYDDRSYVADNPMVTQGLTLRSFMWGLTTSWFDFWHPMTWWSHMLDVTLFGLNPGGHHLVNIALHIANGWLLFWLLQRHTGAMFRSATVAALFLVHPMHVESVAWIAERKDVLSTFFGLLCLHFYSSYASNAAVSESKARRSFIGALVCYALALMAKASVVTWPFVMLLVDIWPMSRLSERRTTVWLQNLWKLTLEKWPFFAMTTASCVITWLGMQSQDNIISGDKVSWAYRLTNVPVSYARYLGKLIWPDDLAVLYPITGPWQIWEVIGAAVVVMGVTAACLFMWQRAKYLTVGWLIFLGTLVPMIGIVAMGHQSMADRYSYIPSIGLFMATVWGFAELTLRLPKGLKWSIAGVIVASYSVVCWTQVQHWRNSETLWKKCLAVEPANAIAHYNLGHVLHHTGRPGEALPHYLEAIRIQPKYLDAHLNLGAISLVGGDLKTATNYFQRALEIKPGYPKAQFNLGFALLGLKDFASATNLLGRAVASEPQNVRNRCAYAWALVELGETWSALEQLSAVLATEPNNAIALGLTGRAYALRGQKEQARQCFLRALLLSPNIPEVQLWAGIQALQDNETEKSISLLKESLRLKPEWADALLYLGQAKAKIGRVEEGVADLRKALERLPEWPEPINALAEILATDPDEKIRDPEEAVRLAERACELGAESVPRFWGTLDSAYAAAGRWADAKRTAEKALKLAEKTGEKQVADAAKLRLAKYEKQLAH